MSSRKTYKLGDRATPRPWKCSKCGGRFFTTFKTRDGLDGVSRNRTYKCSHCGALTFTRETLR